MRKIYALTFRGEPLATGSSEWTIQRTWVTEAQMNRIMSDQDNPDRKGRVYWIGERLFCLRDIASAKGYDYDDPQVQVRLKDAIYLQEALVDEGGNEKARQS